MIGGRLVWERLTGESPERVGLVLVERGARDGVQVQNVRVPWTGTRERRTFIAGGGEFGEVDE